jgi:hypothetical protein
LVKNYIGNKAPDYIKKSLHIETTDGKTILKVDEPYTFHQFIESIS